MTQDKNDKSVENFTLGIHPGSNPIDLEKGELHNAANLHQKRRGVLEEAHRWDEFDPQDGIFTGIWDEEVSGAPPGPIYYDVYSGTGGNMTFTEGSKTVACSTGPTNVNVGDAIRVYHKNNLEYYRITAQDTVAHTLSITPAFKDPTVTLPRTIPTEYAVGYMICPPVWGVHIFTDTQNKGRIVQLRGNTLLYYRETIGGFYSGATVSGATRQNVPHTCEFIDIYGKLYFTDGINEILESDNGAVYKELGDPIIEQVDLSAYFDVINGGIMTEAGNIILFGYDTSGGDKRAVIMRSTDGGETFGGVAMGELLYNFLGQDWETTAMIQTSSGAIVAVSGHETGSSSTWITRVWASVDDGLSWTQQAIGSGANYGFCRGLVETSTGWIYAAVGNNSALFQSNTDGDSWTLSSNPIDATGREFGNLVVQSDESNERVACVNTNGTTIRRTQNNPGKDPTWEACIPASPPASLSFVRTMIAYDPNGNPIWSSEGGTFTTKYSNGSKMLYSWHKIDVLKRLNMTEQVVFFHNTENGLFYALSARLVGATYYPVLAVSSDDGVTFHQVWQSDLAINRYCTFASHISENRFVWAQRQTPARLWRCKYHTNVPRARRLKFYRSRLFAYGDLEERVTPWGATPDAITSDSITYEGQDWLTDELKGLKLYPDARGSDGDVFLTVTANNRQKITLDGDPTTVGSVSNVFEVRRRAPERCRFSEILEYDMWRTNAFFDEDDKIVAILDFLRMDFETPQSGIQIFTPNGQTILLGTDPASWVRYRGGSTKRGCIAPFGHTTDIVMSHDGLAAIVNGNPVAAGGRLDLGVADTEAPLRFIERLNKDTKKTALGFEHNGSRWMAVTLSDEGYHSHMVEINPDISPRPVWWWDLKKIQPRDSEYSFWGADMRPTCVYYYKEEDAIVVGSANGRLYTFYRDKDLYPSQYPIDDKDYSIRESMATFQMVHGGPKPQAFTWEVIFTVWTEVASTIYWQFNSNYRGWSDPKGEEVVKGFNRIRVTFPGDASGFFTLFRLNWETPGRKEIYAPIEFTVAQKGRGV